jgi:hypothetical protein
VPFVVADFILKVLVEQRCQKHWEFKRDSINTGFINEGMKFCHRQTGAGKFTDSVLWQQSTNVTF